MKGNAKLSPSPVRLPLELKNWLKHKAIDNGRSYTAEVTYRLQQSRRTEEQGAAK